MSYYFNVDKIKSIEKVEVFTNQRKGFKNFVRVDYIPLSKPQTMQVSFHKMPFDSQKELTFIKNKLNKIWWRFEKELSLPANQFNII